jgi:hypothetical protein
MTAPGTDLAQYQGSQVEEYRARIVMAPEDARMLDDQLRACTKAVLREDTDYGVIPGTNGDQVLLKPGAEKLLQWFGLGFTNDRQEISYDADGRKEGVTYRCTITKQLGDGRTVPVATCEAYAGYDEDKFFQTAEQAQLKAEAKERFWAEKDRRAPSPGKWKYLTGYRAPWNTIIRMAQKRSLVGGTIDATAAAGLFTGDDTIAAGPDDTAAAAAQDWADGDWPQDATPAATADSRPWLATAVEQAASFTSEAGGQKLFREAAEAGRDGFCTPQQAGHVQNLINLRITERRVEARDRLLDLLSEHDDWRPKVLDLTDDIQARDALAELGQLADQTRAGRISRAIIARFPKAALPDPEATA